MTDFPFVPPFGHVPATFGEPAPNKPYSALDALIEKAIEDAKQAAVKEVMASYAHQLGDLFSDAVRERLRKDVLELLDKDPDVKAKVKESLLKALDNPIPKRTPYRY